MPSKIVMENECSRCEGKGKTILFSSVEDPCAACKGSGTVPVDTDTIIKKDPDDRSLNHLDLMQEFFKDKVGRFLIPSEVYGSYSSSPPTSSDIMTTGNKFYAKYKKVSAGIDPLLLVRMDPPKWYYRRPQGEKLPHSLVVPREYSWNRPSKNKQPYSSLVLFFEDNTTPLASYMMWDL